MRPESPLVGSTPQLRGRFARRLGRAPWAAAARRRGRALWMAARRPGRALWTASRRLGRALWRAVRWTLPVVATEVIAVVVAYFAVVLETRMGWLP